MTHAPLRPSCAAPQPFPRPSASLSVKREQSPTSGPCGPKPHLCGSPGRSLRSRSARGASPCRGGSRAPRASCALPGCRLGSPVLGAETEEGWCLEGRGDRASPPRTRPPRARRLPPIRPHVSLRWGRDWNQMWRRGSGLGPPGGTLAPIRQSPQMGSVAQGLLPHIFPFGPSPGPSCPVLPIFSLSIVFHVYFLCRVLHS